MTSRAVLLLGLLLLVAACGDQITVIDGGTSGSGGAGTTAGAGAGSPSLGLDGEHTLAVSAVLAPNIPFVATATFRGLEMTVVWLDGADRVTPVSGPETVVFDEEGTADAMLDIPAQANAISGSPLVADVTMTFERTSMPACGTVDGMVNVNGALVPIDGSTFALSATEMSVQPVIDCGGATAPPP